MNMLNQDEITQQQALLSIHRRTLAVYLRQQAELGTLTPPGVVNGIHDVCDQIGQIKATLRAQGVVVEDYPDDEPRPIMPISQLSETERRNRSQMFERIKISWIKGVLHQSLYHVAAIELGMQYYPDAVVDPWRLVRQQTNQPTRALSLGTHIVQVFDDIGRALLILGKPGSGKTTLLLTLADTLIARAEQDENQPMPVIFPLSTWAKRRPPIAVWLVDELVARYNVPPKIAQAWVGTDAILPLLDGLDEVQPEHRRACADAINQFRQDHGFLDIVVTTRSADYVALGTQLRLAGAVEIQPLTSAQIDAYLEQAGPPLATVRMALRADPTLKELVETPLMLTIMMLASGRQPTVVLPMGLSLEERRTQLLATYVEQMLQRPIAGTRFTPQQMRSYLVWVAQAMTQYGQTVLFIEWMQPSWLPSRMQRWLVRRIATLILITIGIFIGVLVGGLLGGLIGILFGGLLGGLIGMLVANPSGRATGGLVDEFEARLENEIVNVETLRWSWTDFLKGLFGGVVWGSAIGLQEGLASGVLSALLIAPFFGLLWGVGRGELQIRTIPNEGIHRSVRSAARGGLIFGLYGAVIWMVLGGLIGLLDGLSAGLLSGLIAGLLGGIYFGLGGALRYGGEAVMRHGVLRLILALNGNLPLRLVPFLDEAAARLLLRKVGGGYIFVHRLLLEYFVTHFAESNATTLTDVKS